MEQSRGSGPDWRKTRIGELVFDGKSSSSYGVIWIVRSPPSADFDGEYKNGCVGAQARLAAAV